MEKLADGLQKLNEDDLLHVVTMIHDNKSSDTYTKNDVESKWPRHVVSGSSANIGRQMASFMSISTPSQIHSSRACGTSPLPRPNCSASRQT